MPVVIWIICGFICAGLAGKKNKSVGWGFVGGLLWGIFGIGYYLLCAERK